MSEKDQNEENKDDDNPATKFKNLTEAKLEDINEMFEIIDRDKDGLISYIDLTQLLRWLGFNPTEREMKEYQEQYDTTKTNLVNKRVVMEITNKKVMEPDTIDELLEAMKLFDKNNDGHILVPELRWAMTKLGDCMDESAVDEMIKEVDSDNKGHVDILEFAKVCFAIKEKKGKD